MWEPEKGMMDRVGESYKEEIIFKLNLKDDQRFLQLKKISMMLES